MTAVPMIRSADGPRSTADFVSRLLRFREVGIAGCSPCCSSRCDLRHEVLVVSNIQIIALSIALLLVVAVGETVVILAGTSTSPWVDRRLSAMTVGMVFKSYSGCRRSSPSPSPSSSPRRRSDQRDDGRLPASAVGRSDSRHAERDQRATYLVADGNQVNPFNVPERFVELSINSPIGVPRS